MKKILLGPWLSILVLGLLVWLQISNPPFLESVRLRYFDQLIVNQDTVQNNIYTVNIDEDAIKQNGQWPWPRNKYADLIKDLYARGAGLVVFNVFMPESDRAGQDAALADVLKSYPVVLTMLGAEESKNEPINPGAAIINSDYIDLIPGVPGIISNVPILENNAVGSGIVNTFPELDGVTRRVPLVIESNGVLYPNITLEVLRVIAGDPSFQIKLSPMGIDKLRIPQFGPIPTDELGRVWIDWSQNSVSVDYNDLPASFDGAVVFVTPTAAGLNNPISTAVGGVWPHELQAALLGTVFNKSNIERPAWAPGAELLLFGTLALLVIILARWTYVGLAVFVIVTVGSISGSIYLFASYNWLVDGVVIPASLILVGLTRYAIKFLSEYLQKMQIKKQFGTYLSPAMVEKLQKNPELLTLGGESRELSIMFTDVRGFTTISEHYGEDVQGLTKIMNRYMTAMTAKILENEGTLDKYIGDAQMAFWNAPLDDPQHAKHAVRTGIAMLKDLEKFNEEIAKEGIPAFGMGLGINTATVVVGNMGSSQRFDYTCLGDGVNLASRLEGQSKPYGVKIIIGALTAQQVKDEFPVVELDLIAVKGKTEPVKIYTILTNDIGTNEFWHYHGQYLESYRSGAWMIAKGFIESLYEEAPVELHSYYAAMNERIDEMIAAKVKNFDGVYRATSK